MLQQLWQQVPGTIRVGLISVIISILYLLPHLIASEGAIYGDDLHFHLDRVRGLAGIWQSPVNFKSFYRIGQGVNFFYPYLTFLPFYWLYTLSHNLYLAWMMYLFGLTTLGYGIAYYSAKGMTQNSRTGHFFALFYTFATYRFVNHAIRFAAGELVATTFLPLVFYGLYLILKGQSKKWYYLSFGIVLVLYSHLLSFVMMIGFVIFFFIIGIGFSDHRLKRTRDFILAALSSFIMSSFQLLPMLEQMHLHNYITPGKFSDTLDAKPFKDLIMLAWSNNVSQHTFGLMILVAFAISLLFIRKFKAFDYLLLALTIVLVIIQTPNLVVKPFEPIQFIWRFNAYITLFALFLAAKFLGTSHFKNGKAYLLLLVLLMIGHSSLTLKTYHASRSYPANPVGELSKRNDFKTLTNSIILMDYANPSDDKTRQIYDADSKVHHRVFDQASGDQLQSTVRFTNTSAKFTILNPTADTQVIELPLYHYKGQYATVDGIEAPTIVSKRSGSTLIHLPPGEHRVTVTYHYTTLAKTCFVMAILTLTLTLYYILDIHLNVTYRLLTYFQEKKRKTSQTVVTNQDATKRWSPQQES